MHMKSNWYFTTQEKDDLQNNYIFIKQCLPLKFFKLFSFFSAKISHTIHMKGFSYANEL